MRWPKGRQGGKTKGTYKINYAEPSAFRVGYESPSQFGREYRRLFGAPPRRDVAALTADVQPAG
jgi:AraC-like DNA-binding protein